MREENEAIDRMVESGEWQKQIDELKRKRKKVSEEKFYDGKIVGCIRKNGSINWSSS